MSNLETLIADGNSAAARRARVKLQPRDKKGRWVPTGASLISAIKNIGKVKGKAIGGTATKKNQLNKIRMLVGKGYESKGIPENTVLEVDPKNGELETGIKLSRDFLKKKGINPDIQHTLPKSLAEQPQDLADMNPQPADDLDIELASGGLNDDEDKDFRKEREQEPLAKLPPAMEVLEGEEVADLLDGQEDVERDGEDPEELDGDASFDGDTADAIMQEAMEEAFWGGKPNPDVVISEAKEAPKPENVAAKDLQPGDVISLGPRYNNRAAKVARVDNKQDLEGRDYSEIYVEDIGPDGEKREAKVGGRIPQDAPVTRLRKAEDAPKKPATEKPEKPKAERKPKPEPEPEPEATPEPESTPEPEAPAKPAQKPVDSRKMDDGKRIAEQVFSDEEINELRKGKLENLIDFNGEAVVAYNTKGKAYNPKDPNAMLNYLANSYKNSKFDENGHLVLMREVSKENGKKTQWEIRAAVTGDKKVAYMVKLKDLDTGEETDLLYKDQRDSVTSLFGKTNGPQRLADILTGRYQPRYNQYVDNKNAKDPFERARYWAAQGRTKTLEDSTKYYAQGYAERINMSDGTLLEKEVPGVYAAIEEGDWQSAAYRLEAVMGGVPVDSKSHAIVMETLRAQYKSKFPGGDVKDAQKFSALVTNASNKYMKGLGNDPRATAVPWSSGNKINVVEVGQVVEYENNVGEKSVVKVVGRQLVNTANPSQSDGTFDYGDYVSIIGSDGKRTSVPSNSLRILKDQKTPLTELKTRVSGRRLREERGMLYNPSTLRFPGQQDVPDRVMPVDDSVPGDNFYSKSGDNLGVIIEAKPVTGKDGKKGFGILYMNRDGELRKVAVASGEERGPRITTSNAKPSPDPKQRTVEADYTESDPDFDLDSIEFDTDISTIERPKTVGLDFNVPAGAKRNAEQQLALNDEVQKEIDETFSEIANTSLGDGWTYDASSFSAKSYFNAGELAKLVAAARAEYPDLTDSEIRTLLELKHSKQRGFFGKTKQQMISDILKEAAIFRKNSGGIQDLRFDVSVNKETGKAEIQVPADQVKKYADSVDSINTFINNNPKFISKLDGTNGSQYVRVVADKNRFQALYNSISLSFGDRSRVLGVNIAHKDMDGNLVTAILINDGSLSSGAKPDGDFGDASVHTFIHEFGHTIGNLLASEKGGALRLGGDYDAAFKDFITKYGEKSRDEHFADSFAKYIMTGEASDAFLDFLRASDLIDNV